MSVLPPIIRRAPVILYGLAVFFFVASFVLTVIDIDISMAGAENGNPMVRQAKLRGLYQAALEAVYIAANGILAQILIAIWENGAERDGRGDE